MIFLLLNIVLITYLKQQLLRVQPISYIGIYCPEIEKNYKGNEQDWSKLAVAERSHFLKQENQKKFVAKHYHCYCANKNPDFSTYKLIFERDENDFCYDWKFSQLIVTGLSNGISLIVVLLNQVAYTICIYCIDVIRLHYKSDQQAAYTIAVAFCQVFNTGWLIMLSAIKIDGKTAHSLGLDAGNYRDFESVWFYEMAPLISTSFLIYVVWPFIEVFYMWLYKKLFEWYDKTTCILCCCFCRDRKRTRQTTLQGYISVHQGMEFKMHNQYACIINLVFVAFMHGMTMPILFPLALLGIGVQYCLDKIRLVYVYKRPPMYDGKQISLIIDILIWAPLNAIFMLIWQLSDQKIFKGVTSTLTLTGDPMTVFNHEAIDASGLHILPLFVVLLTYLVFIVWQNLCGSDEHYLSHFNENPGNYWGSLSGMDQKRWFTEELMLRKWFNISLIDDVALRKLRLTKHSKKKISGSVNYQILNNYLYAEKFMYTTLERRTESLSSEICLKLIYAFENNDQKDKANIEINLQESLLNEIKKAQENYAKEMCELKHVTKKQLDIRNCYDNRVKQL